MDNTPNEEQGYQRRLRLSKRAMDELEGVDFGFIYFPDGPGPDDVLFVFTEVKPYGDEVPVYETKEIELAEAYLEGLLERLTKKT